MLSLSPQVRVFLCTHPADMRQSFDGLSGLVSDVFGQEPLSGDLLVSAPSLGNIGDRMR